MIFRTVMFRKRKSNITFPRLPGQMKRGLWAYNGYRFALAFHQEQFSIPVRPLWKLNIFMFVKFEVFTAVTLKNAVFWDVALCTFLWTGVSEERIASIFRVEKSTSEGPALAGVFSL
jgi:hypothetical protein